MCTAPQPGDTGDEGAKGKLRRLDGEAVVPPSRPRRERMQPRVYAAQIPRRELSVRTWRGEPGIVVGKECESPTADELIHWHACGRGETGGAVGIGVDQRMKEGSVGCSVAIDGVANERPSGLIEGAGRLPRRIAVAGVLPVMSVALPGDMESDATLGGADGESHEVIERNRNAAITPHTSARISDLGPRGVSAILRCASRSVNETGPNCYALASVNTVISGRALKRTGMECPMPRLMYMRRPCPTSNSPAE